ncbi:MAG: hypothetical protein JWQ13_1563 [Ramlibacter sp.]|jgi:hypothetical protein|nr:hypothetical protein [Ramlibacter sp.]
MQQEPSPRGGPHATAACVTNRQRLARYDRLIERAEERAEYAGSLATRRRYLHLMLRLQERALRAVTRCR